MVASIVYTERVKTVKNLRAFKLHMLYWIILTLFEYNLAIWHIFDFNNDYSFYIVAILLNGIFFYYSYLIDSKRINKGYNTTIF
jgi:hypothetical protein